MCFWFSTTVEVNVTSMGHDLIRRCTLQWALNCFPYVIASIACVLQSSSGNTNKAIGEVNFRLKEFLLRSLLTKLTFFSQMGQLRDDLRRTTEQYRELNQALAQQQQQITSLQVSSVRELKLGER